MIAQLQGKISFLQKNSFVIQCSGMGYAVRALQRLLSGVALGDTLTIWTHLAVREDALDLYGFSEREEIDFFQMLITVPGIGSAFIGLYDLSFSLGIPGETHDPELEANVLKVLTACKKHNVPCGLPVSGADIEKRLEQGFRFVTTVIDRGDFAKEAFRCSEIFKRKYR